MGLKEKRLDSELSQVELAELAGVAQSMISMIERGLTPSTEALLALATALKCEPVELLEPHQMDALERLPLAVRCPGFVVPEGIQ